MNPSFEGNRYIYAAVAHFNNIITNVPTAKNNAPYAVISIIHKWLSFLRPVEYLITDLQVEEPISQY